jgi:hypothetical protein
LEKIFPKRNLLNSAENAMYLLKSRKQQKNLKTGSRSCKGLGLSIKAKKRNQNLAGLSLLDLAVKIAPIH